MSFSLNLATLKSVSNFGEAAQKDVAGLWARSRLQRDLPQEKRVGIKRHLVSSPMVDRLNALYQKWRIQSIGYTAVVYGRPSSGKTTAAVGLIKCTQGDYDKLPYAYLFGGRDLKKSICSVLLGSDTWTDNECAKNLMQALSPYRDFELKAADGKKKFFGWFESINFCASGGNPTVSPKDGALAPAPKVEYKGGIEGEPLPVLVIDELRDTNSIDLMTNIFQEASRQRVFVVVNTPSEQVANMLCAANGKSRIGPYHLQGNAWNITGDEETDINWTDTDKWSRDQIQGLILSAYPQVKSFQNLYDKDNDIVLFLQEEVADHEENQYDLRQPSSSLQYTTILLSEGMTVPDFSRAPSLN